ncbi:hypothetical protein BGZ61DRAFT_178050 [Ilyonectria robusta]|uniref:uncharacterized protein n=1 Tax=Ilyonectria robusta TaxID=1079257 RepID=UPI001E8DA53B|nr:uncharacterized protein BGZ61DRAFT_178050 [Ilyonectria robusta]KAH8729196.1 hypothetical protein BGZ61DRAFT_178050 [Ilyonectria robusta]
MAFNDRYDSSAIDSDSDWESDGHDEMVRSFQRVPYTKPPARASLISIEMAGGMIPGNPGTLPTNPGPPPSNPGPLPTNSGTLPTNASGPGRHTLRRTGKATAKSLAISESELSSYLSNLSMSGSGSGSGSGSQANSNSSLGASTTTAATSQSNSNPDEGCLMMANRRPRKEPAAESESTTKFLTQPANTPVIKINSPKVIRQEMVKRELSESLRLSMIWERSHKNATANAVLKRRHTAPNVRHLRRQRKFSRPSANMSCQELQIIRNGYNDKGW